MAYITELLCCAAPPTVVDGNTSDQLQSRLYDRPKRRKSEPLRYRLTAHGCSVLHSTDLLGLQQLKNSEGLMDKLQLQFDDIRDASRKAKYTGLLSRLTSKAFVNNLGIMMDALTELANLSRELQQREMTLTRVQKLVDRQICLLESMAESPGTCATEVREAVESNMFHGVELGRITTQSIH